MFWYVLFVYKSMVFEVCNSMEMSFELALVMEQVYYYHWGGF
jgi:hypothetical protein